jgi:hypothetical protein
MVAVLGDTQNTLIITPCSVTNWIPKARKTMTWSNPQVFFQRPFGPMPKIEGPPSPPPKEFLGLVGLALAADSGVGHPQLLV